MKVKQISQIAIMSSLIYVGRIMFQFLPNVQPMTVVLMLVTLHFGIKEGLLTATLSLLMSNLYLGMGPWTIAQLISFSILILLTGALRPVRIYIRPLGWAFLAFFFGYLYGFVISAVQVAFYTKLFFIPYYLAGLSFDTMHAVGNLFFWLILSPVLSPLFEKENKLL